MELLPAVIILVGLFGGAFIARHYEKRDWNNGFCRKTGQPWKSFDMDSQGGRGYTDGQGNYTWVSYNVDKKSVGEDFR